MKLLSNVLVVLQLSLDCVSTVPLVSANCHKPQNTHEPRSNQHQLMLVFTNGL